MINVGRKGVVWVLFFILVAMMSVSVFTVKAGSMEDNVASYSNTSDANDVGNWIKSQRGLTGEQLNVASGTLSPLTNAIGYVVGGIVVLIFSGITLITAADLLYIAIPPVRNVLYKSGTEGTGAAYTGGMPGGGYNRGMGMMGMGGVGSVTGGPAKSKQWVSDEAVQCVILMGSSATNQMGGPMGSGMQQPNAQVNKGSVITAYFKKRALFLVILAVCVIILTSSALLGTGVNLAQWGIKLINIVNGYIPK